MFTTIFLWAHAGLLEAMSPSVPRALQDLVLPRSTMHPAFTQETTPTTHCLPHPRLHPLPHLDQALLLPLLGQVLPVAAQALAVVQRLTAVVAVRLVQTLAVAVEAPAAAQQQRHLAVSLPLLVCAVPIIAPKVNNCGGKP